MYNVRGNVFEGKVLKNKMQNTAIIGRDVVIYVPKYERYAKRNFRLAVHVPEGMHLNVGDVVKVGETRKISKTKSFVVVEVLKKVE